jgi:hypothetical protein
MKTNTRCETILFSTKIGTKQFCHGVIDFILVEVLAATGGGPGDLQRMLETKHQWWADTYAEVHKMGKLQHALPDEDKFPNSQVDRKKPPCSFIGTEQGPCKVAIAGFDTSNVNRERLKSPHALQILAKIDREISRQGPKIFRPTTGPGRNLVVRVGREEEGVSSLRPELAVIARTIQANSVEVDLLYLCNS